MKAKTFIALSLCLLGWGTISTSAFADGAKPVTTGKLIRGVTLAVPPGPAPVAGQSTGKPCDFTKEEVNPTGQITGASVNCLPGGTAAQVLEGLPPRFNAYCVIDASALKSARVLQAAVPDNANHCDLSGIKPADAAGQFKGAVWR
jgi:hypothetical protein